MSTTRIDAPSTPPAASPRADPAERRRPDDATASDGDLAEALGDLARLLAADDQATRLARAQSQVEALLYAAQLAGARGYALGRRGAAAEADRIARSLVASGLSGSAVADIASQAGRVAALADRTPPAPQPDPDAPA